MERIRVDTDKLKEKSKEFETSAGVFSTAGAEILTVAAGLPSYDGQLSTPARAAALEINRQSQDLHRSFMNISQSLTKTAQAFEEVDNRTIVTINKSEIEISKTPIGQYFSGKGPEISKQKVLYDHVGDGGIGGETVITTPFFDPNADVNGTVAGTMTFLPDGACVVEDDGEAPKEWWDAFAQALNLFIDWLGEITGSKKVQKKVIGETIEFYLEYSRDTKGTGGFKINGVTVRNNSKETIRIDYVYIEVNGVQYRAEVVGAPIFVHPGEVVNIQIRQDTPIFPFYLGATVTLRGARPGSCDSGEQDLITLTIPPINQPTDVTK
jgi:uncharacterized protein YukE